MKRGTLVGDRFEISNVAGIGGMGTVYYAIDRSNGQPAALKVLDSTTPDQLLRFQREADILAALDHPAIVRYIDHGTTHDQEPYLAMQWLAGETLDVRLKRGRLALDHALALVTRIAEALAVAHQRGVIHRDIKPQNLLLPASDVEHSPSWRYANVVVLDFGIARPGRRADFSTRTGEIVGSPGYMAPEQARGDRALDATADIFALGCVLYECIAGQAPFIAEHVVGVLAKVLFETPTNLYELRPSIPPALVDITNRMLNKDPKERFRTGMEVLAALRNVTVDGTEPELEDTAPPAIGTQERQLLSVIIASEHHTSSTKTIDTGTRQKVVHNIRPIVREHGGALEELADNSLVVSFAPTGVATDQATRAVHCALQMRKQLTHYTIALATGCGEVDTGLPIGEVLDRAVRRLKTGNHNSQGVLIDELTAGLLGVGFQISGAGEGLALGLEEDTSPQPTLMGQVTPFVGRRRELNTLMDTYEECLEDSVARVVLVTGAPGLGKSRLASELLARIENSADSQTWIGRGDVMGDAAPFRLLASALRHELNLQHGEALSSSHQKLRGRLQRHFDDGAIAELAPPLGTMLSVPFEDAALPQDPLLMRDLIRQAWIDLLMAECKQRAVVLTLDDVQWGDLPSIKLIDVALRALRHKPFMVLALARPEIHQRFPNMWHERGLSELRLPELSKRSSGKLVSAVLAQVNEAQTTRLIEQAGGNPLYLEELLREAARPSSHRLPATVLAMLQVRLDTLAPELRRVLRAASVFGTVFWFEAVVALLRDDSERVNEWMNELLAQELVIASHTAKFPRMTEYRFRHELLRQVAYNMFTDHDQRVAHHLAARWLHQTGETEAAVLANHYELGGEPSSAVTWYRRAAARALEGDDFEAALTHAARGVGCNRGATNEALGKLRLIQSDAHRWRGEPEPALRYAREAFELLPIGELSWYSALRALAMVCRELHQLQAEDETRLRVLLNQQTTTSQERRAWARAIAVSACQLLLCGEHELYTEFRDKLQQFEGDILDPELEASLCEAHALEARSAGDPGGYLQHMNALVTCESRRGAVRLACKARVNLGYAAREIGALEESRQVLAEARVDARRMGLDALAAAADHNLGFTLALLGDFAAGAELEQSAAEDFHRFGISLMEGASRIFLALIYSRSNAHERALEEIRHALTILADLPATLAVAEGALAEILLLTSQPKEALEAAQRGMRHLTNLGSLEEGEPRLRLAYAEALLACGRHTEGQRQLLSARDKLLERADQIGDPTLRVGFLSRIPEHARTLKLAAEVSAS